MPAKQFSMCEVGHIASPAERRGLHLGQPWDARLVSCKLESWNGWDPSTRKPDGMSEQFLVVTFERNCEAEKGRPDEHFAEVYDCVHKVVAQLQDKYPGKTLSIKMVGNDGREKTWLHSNYLQSAYEVCTLGKFRKASPEVEALIAGASSVALEEGKSC